MLVLIVMVAVLTLPALASAHARLIQSDPTSGQIVQDPPQAVTLTFSEPIENALGTIRVFDRTTRRVDGDATTRDGSRVLATRLQGRLSSGTYTVSWRVASADGHPIDGAFVFHVGAPGKQSEGIAAQVATRPPTAVLRAADIGRFLNLVLVVALIGAIAANLAIFAGRDPELERRLWYVIAGLGFGLSIVAGATVVLHAAVIAGAGLDEATNGTTLSAVLGTRFGHVRLAQLILAEVIAIAAVWAPSPTGAMWFKRGIGVLAAGLAVTPGLSGHAGAEGALAVVADTGHVIAASVWVGGLAAVMLGLALAGERRRDLARVAIPRFSTLALGSVAVLLVAGSIGGLIHVGQVSDLWNTTYGKLLVAKIAIALVLIGFGVFNRRAVRRLSERDSPGGVLTRLQRSVAVEFVLMAVAIGVTSVLITKPPARAVAAARPVVVSTTGQIGDVGVRLVADPGTAGPNVIHVYLTRDKAPTAVDEVTVTAGPKVASIGPFKWTVIRAEPGHYVTPRIQVPVAGLWAFDVAIRRGEFDLDAVTLEAVLREGTHRANPVLPRA